MYRDIYASVAGFLSEFFSPLIMKVMRNPLWVTGFCENKLITAGSQGLENECYLMHERQEQGTQRVLSGAFKMLPAQIDD